DITVEKLATDSYQAQTRNKLIAEAFYLTGDIEKYGSGYIRIREEISAYPGMKFGFEEMGNGYLVTLSSGTVEGITEQATEQAVLAFCRQPRSTTEIMHHLGLRHREHFRSSILMPLLERQLLRLTIPDKPSSPKQKYITTTSQAES
ncbi:MAG: hypothetical protein GX043_09245, partial [Desulfovibrionales bacterium]|nr:hypothetical protein [Desulfovibrionales bacterium]